MRPFAISSAVLVLFSATPASVSAEVRILKGPYLMDARSDSVAVMFELSEAAPATVVVTHADEEVARLSSTASDFHEVLLDGLTPRSTYDYRIDAGEAVAEGTLTTAPAPGEGPIRFLVAGDNRTDAQAHAAVVERMREHPADFIINTGDMVANGADAEDWQELFDVERELLRGTPLFPAMGNHELYRYGVGLPGFLRYTRVPDTLGGEETYYGFDWGPVRFLMLDSNDDWEDTESAQRLWLIQQLDAADDADTVAHVIVALHHGPVSSNAHGGHPDMMSTGVLHLFRRHGVALVLSGHDHAYERGDAHGVKYIVTGGGGAPLYHENDPLPFQHRFEASHHFLVVDASRERIDVAVRRVDDSLIERCGFDRGQRWTCERPEGGDQVVSTPVSTAEPQEEAEPDEAARHIGLPLVIGALVVLGFVAFWFTRKNPG